ncbi:hypothetical protein SMMN14_06720 [Sphaerulina musiva]
MCELNYGAASELRHNELLFAQAALDPQPDHRQEAWQRRIARYPIPPAIRLSNHILEHNQCSKLAETGGLLESPFSRDSVLLGREWHGEARGGWHEQLHRCLWPPSHDHIVIEYLMQHACQAVLLLALYPWRPVDAPSTCNPVVTRHPQCSQRHAPPSRPKASLLGTLTRLMDVLLVKH